MRPPISKIQQPHQYIYIFCLFSRLLLRPSNTKAPMWKSNLNKNKAMQVRVIDLRYHRHPSRLWLIAQQKINTLRTRCIQIPHSRECHSTKMHNWTQKNQVQDLVPLLLNRRSKKSNEKSYIESCVYINSKRKLHLQENHHPNAIDRKKPNRVGELNQNYK